MTIAIIGTGAMACLFGARLSRVGDVVLIGTWADAIDAVERDGIHVEGEGTFSARAAGDPADAPPAELAVVLVKTYQTERAARWAARALGPDGVALTAQNGLGNVEALAAQAGVERAMLGVTTEGATLLGPGRVRSGGRGTTSVGFPRLARTAGPRHPTARTADEVSALFNAAGLTSVVSEDVEAEAWIKVIANAAINPLTALLRLPNGGLLESEETRQLMGEIVAEAAAVATAHGVELPDDPYARAARVAQGTAANHSSMLQDVLRGRRTEIDAINGMIVERGRAAGIPVPVNAALTHLVRALEATRAPDGATPAATIRRPLRRTP